MDKTEEIWEALKAATPGPWEVTETGTLDITKGYRFENGKHVATWIAEMNVDDEGELQHENANLIANAPEWLTYLLQENDRLRRALDRIGFYCAGTEFKHVSDFVLRVKNGEQV